MTNLSFQFRIQVLVSRTRIGSSCSSCLGSFRIPGRWTLRGLDLAWLSQRTLWINLMEILEWDQSMVLALHLHFLWPDELQCTARFGFGCVRALASFAMLTYCVFWGQTIDLSEQIRTLIFKMTGETGKFDANHEHKSCGRRPAQEKSECRGLKKLEEWNAFKKWWRIYFLLKTKMHM